MSFANPLASRATGVSVVHQEIVICPDLTAAQNVLLGHDLPKRGGLIDWAEVNRRAGLSSLNLVWISGLPPSPAICRLPSDNSWQSRKRCRTRRNC